MIYNPYKMLFQWISMERWGLSFLKIFSSFGIGVNVTFINLITYSLLATSVIILCYIFWRAGIKKNYLLIGSFIYLTSPLIIEQTNFILQSAEVVFSFCILYIGIIMIQLYFESKKSCFLFISQILTILAFSIYQSTIMAFIVLSIIILYLMFKDNELLEYIKKGLICSIVLITSLIVNKIISYCVIWILKLKYRHYLDDQFIIGKVNFQDFSHLISKSFTQYFISYNNYFLFNYFLLALTFLSLFCIIIIFNQKIGKKKMGNENLIISFISIIGIYFICIFPLLTTLYFAPRVYVPTVPIALFFLVVIFLSKISIKSIKKISIILILILCLGQMKVTSDFGMSEEAQFQQEIALLTEIKNFLNNANITNTEDYKLAVLGGKTFENNQIIKGDTIGRSFFEWDDGWVRNSRLTNFFYNQGLKLFQKMRLL
jgi:hypothetical protein